MTGFVKQCSNKGKNNSFLHNSWFDNECKEAKARRRVVLRVGAKTSKWKFKVKLFKIQKNYKNLIYIHKSGKMYATINHNSITGIRAMRLLVDLTTNKKMMVSTMCDLFSALLKPILI